jgi:hypothetical protein
VAFWQPPAWKEAQLTSETSPLGMDQVTRVWGDKYSFSHDPDGHPEEPYAARWKGGEDVVRAATPALLLDEVKEHARLHLFEGLT